MGEAENIENISPYSYDITEIDGFDNLHNAEGILKERMEKVSEFYESGKSYFLVNGSTAGILSAIGASCYNKSKIIMARNSHKAAYNSVFINKLEAVYLYPDIIDEYGISGGIDTADVERLIVENRDAGAVYITSPTYEGIVSEVLEISRICHKYNMPLIVDEAHGAHFSMHDKFPLSALELGADIVIQSLHKTLPSLTQTAILHVGRQSLIDYREIERYLSIYQTSSPSYVLMASIDRCLDTLMKDTFMPFEILSKRIEEFKEKCRKFTNIQVLGREITGKNNVYDFDMSKIVIFVKSNEYSGHVLYEKLLDKYHLQMEMVSLKYVIAMTSIMDSDEGFDRLYNALEEIDRNIRIYERPVIKDNSMGLKKSVKSVISSKICDAVYKEKEKLLLDDAQGRVSGEFVFLYPPGIPLVAPGELFTREITDYIKECRYNGLNIVGMDKENKYVTTVKESWSSLKLENLKTYRIS